MKIVVNNIAASSGGALSILKNFYSYIINTQNCIDIEWIFLLSDTFFEETSNIKIKLFPKTKKNWINRLLFDFYKGKKIIKELNPDIVLSMQNTIIRGLTVPQILYVHQSIPFQKEKKFTFLKKNERKLAVYQYLIGKLIIDSIKMSDFIIVQSQWMKNSILNNHNVMDDKIEVIFPEFDKTSITQCEYEYCNQFFYPAADLIYKNHNLIYSAVKELRNRNTINFNVYLTIVNEVPLSNVEYLGHLSRPDVLKMYRNTILIFPSYIETIGLPLVEAMLTGSLIFVADCEYSREVLGDYKNAYFFDPFNYLELAELMQKAIMNRIKRSERDKFEINKHNGWNELINVMYKLNSSHI